MIKNIFISHIHKHDKQVEDIKNLISKAGMDARNGSIDSSNPNNAKSPDYIKQGILAPRINWASSLVVLITPGSAKSDWVNWEINYANQKGKTIVGVWGKGAKKEDMPEELDKCGDATLVSRKGELIVSALKGETRAWDEPASGNPRPPTWPQKRYRC